ncbi:MAG TPA: hypothetical protein PLA94_03635 [Myxococcota bacterium]|nr:hypothetical protein [Myxococcota bacterium]
MMLVKCVEGNRRPAVVTLAVDEGDIFGIYLLEDVVESDSGLRATVLRPVGVDPPPQSVLVMELEVVPSASRTGHLFQVRAIGRKVTVELARTDRRSRATRNGEIRPGTKVEVAASAYRRFDFVLQLQGGSGSDAMAATASGNKSAAQLANQRATLWRIPGASSLARNAEKALKDGLKDFGKRLGLSATTTRFLVTGLFFLAGAGAVWYREYSRAEEAATEASKAKEMAARAGQAREASLQGEQACLAERQVLVKKLGNEDEAKRLAAESAMSASSAVGVAIEVGGGLFGADSTRKIDDNSRPALIDAVVAAMEKVPEAPAAEGCMALEGLLSTDLPRYLLLWSPDPESLCPDAGSRLTRNGVELVGRWGLSERMSKEFGVEDPALQGGGEPRVYPRWSLQTLAVADRQIQQALLTFDARGRPTVNPSESQAWALTLVGAYNQLGSPAEGALNSEAPKCVAELLEAQLNASGSATPGSPVLPPLSEIAAETKALSLSPTPGCPWNPATITEAAQNTIRAMAALAVVSPTAPAAGAAAGAEKVQ